MILADRTPGNMAALSRPAIAGARRMAESAALLVDEVFHVSASLALTAGIEPQVEIWADPAVSSNQHEIEAQGEFGKVAITNNNLPSPDNPATSYLAELSVLTLLRDLADPVTVGT
jgi:aspartate dehydrogenase